MIGGRSLRALALGTALLGACSRSGGGPDVVARVGGRPLHWVEFQESLERHLGDEWAGLGNRVMSELLDQWLDERALLRLAEERGLVAPGADPWQAVEALLDSALDAAVSPADVEDHYRRHGGEFSTADTVRLRQILVEDRQTAERVIEELGAGKDFAEVARRLSIDPSAQRGGAQGVLSRDDLPPPFVEPVFRLAPGQFSEIVAADYGFHVFQVTERWEGPVLTLEEAAPTIRERLRRERADAALARLVDEARSHYNVRVFERNLPFRYQGAFPTR